MNIPDLAKALTGKGVYYRPFSPSDIVITAGLPPLKLTAWDYVKAVYNKPQSKRIGNLAGSGVFVSNHNRSGIIEIGITQGMVSGALLELFDIAGIPIPIVIVDGGSGTTSGVIATACKRIETPEWYRSARPNVIPFTFEATRLVISWGMQLIDETI